MSNNGYLITAPVSVNDIKTVIGVNDTNVPKLFLLAQYGGYNNGAFKQAFWTREHNQTGTAGEGMLIDGAEPVFNIFSEKSPVEWIQFGDEIRPKLKKSDNVPTYVDSKRIVYSFNIQDFNGYNHRDVKAELASPASITSDSTTKNMDIVYSIPHWMNKILPEVNEKSFYVLTTFVPNDDQYGIKFSSVVRILANQGAFVFQTRLEGIPQYKDQELDLDFYVSVWDYSGANINIPSLDKADYTFRYKMPNIARMYHTIMNIKGTKDRPAQVIPMIISIDMATAGIVSDGYYTRISSNIIEVNLLDLELISKVELIVDDLGYSLGTINTGYYPIFTRRYNFPSTNHNRFTIRAI